MAIEDDILLWNERAVIPMCHYHLFFFFPFAENLFVEIHTKKQTCQMVRRYVDIESRVYGARNRRNAIRNPFVTFGDTLFALNFS